MGLIFKQTEFLSLFELLGDVPWHFDVLFLVTKVPNK